LSCEGEFLINHICVKRNSLEDCAKRLEHYLIVFVEKFKVGISC